MKTIHNLDFTRDKYVVIDDKSQTVMEIKTGKIYVAVPHDEPETTVALFEPVEWFDTEEKLTKALQESKFFKELKEKFGKIEKEDEDDSFIPF